MEIFSLFPEYLFIDVTYNIDYWNFGVFLLCIVDNNKNL